MLYYLSDLAVYNKKIAFSDNFMRFSQPALAWYSGRPGWYGKVFSFLYHQIYIERG